ncbi:MAG: (Fe-S)-binding protein [Coriobacteriales bacterium]|nr:(Fe-S)-binding protein [Coriobacteriales bacterium]
MSDTNGARLTLSGAAARPWRVDMEPNIFSLMRACQASQLDDCFVSEAPKDTIFVPGCMLSAESLELTTAVYSWLCAHSLVDGITFRCCGNILKTMSSPAEREQYLCDLRQQLAVHEVSCIITACPNCYKAFNLLKNENSLCDYKVLALSEVLAKSGMRIRASDTSYCIHDSCPDRTSGVFAASVRSLFSSTAAQGANCNTLCEMKHNREQSRCCGLGKMLSLTDPNASAKMREARAKEFFQTDANKLVTYCATCTQAFQTSEAKRYCWHYLELLFDIEIDWQANQKRFEHCLACVSG